MEILIEITQTRDMAKWKETDIELASNSIETIITELLKRYQDLRNKLDSVQSLNKLFFRTEEPFKHKLEISFDNNPKTLEIAGRIDWITADADNKEVTIWDFKTSSDEYLERDIAQVVIYSIMIKEIFEVDTSAALMYISADKTTPYLISSDKINKIKKSVLRTIYDMSVWMEETGVIPVTPYQDACEDCIVKKFCYQKKFPTCV